MPGIAPLGTDEVGIERGKKIKIRIDRRERRDFEGLFPSPPTRQGGGPLCTKVPTGRGI